MLPDIKYFHDISMRLLICGLLENDSGKTTLGIGITRNLIEIGYEIGVFKPLSFHNWYYQYDASLENYKRGLLFSEDILKLMKAAKLDLPPELLNPVDGITFPPIPSFFIERRILARYYSIFENTLSMTGLIRFSIRGTAHLNIYALNESLIDKDYFLYDKNFIKRLLGNAHVCLRLNGVEQLYNVLRYYAPIAIKSCYQYLKRLFRNIIIESLNDAATPSSDTLDVDLVLITAPGAVIAYDGNKYRKAIYLYASFHKTLEIRTSDIITLLTPIKVFKIKPLTKAELEDYDRLAKKYMEVAAFVEKFMEE